MATYVTFHQGHTECSVKCAQGKLAYMSLVMRKPAFCTCNNKDADQIRGNREADQRLCFCYTDSTIRYFLNPKFPASSHLL